MAFIPDEAVDRMTELSSGAWRLYCYLARCRNQRSGKCCPSVAVTMEAIGVNRGSVYALRKELVSEKWARFDGDSAVLLVGFDSLNNQTLIAAVKELNRPMPVASLNIQTQNHSNVEESLKNQTADDDSNEFSADISTKSEKSDNVNGSLNNRTGKSEKSEKQSEKSDLHIRKNQQIEPAKEPAKVFTPPFQPEYSESPILAPHREPDIEAIDEIQAAIVRITGMLPIPKNLPAITSQANEIFQAGGSAALLNEYASQAKTSIVLNFVAQNFCGWLAMKNRERTNGNGTGAKRTVVV